MKKFLLILFLFSFNLFAEHDKKILNKEFIPRVKYAVDFELPINDGQLPNEKIMQEIAFNEKLKNPGYKNYFINFYLPKMKLDNGAFGISNNINNSNPEMKVKISYETLLYDSNYSKSIKKDSNGNYYLENYQTQTNKIKQIKIDSLNKIGAKIIIDYFTTNGNLKIYGSSNLPKGMKLLITLENKKLNYRAQDTVVLSNNGQFETESFSNNNFRLKKGTYTLIISSPYVFIQPENVQKIIGKKGEKLKSDITVEEDEIYFIKYKSNIKI